MIPVFGRDQEVAEWVGRNLNKPMIPPYTAIGWVDEAGTPKFGAVFNSWNGSNIEVTIYGPGALTRAVIRTVLAYVFNQVGANRLTATTERKNKRMRDLLPRLGFSFEFVQKQFFGPNKRNDGVVFCMMKDDARKWLK